MSQFLKYLKNGNWITAKRARVYTRLLLAMCMIAAAAWIGLADGLRDRSGKPIGTDFLNVYTAGIMISEGRADKAYDWPAQHEVEAKVVGYDNPYYGWHYPPPFLFVARVVAFFPYLAALALYLGFGFAAYFYALRRIAAKHKETSWAIAAFPAVFINIGNGQNGFITTALLGLGLFLLETRPVISGLLFGLLVYKPQFFVLIPILLLAGKNWKAFFATAVSSISLCALSFLTFGQETWLAFFGSRSLTQHLILENGTTGWNKIQSVFSAVRMWGGGLPAAYFAQTVVSLTAICIAIWVWRKKPALEIRASALCAATLLMTPYLLDYDLTILALPIAFLSAQIPASGAVAYEKTLLAALWIWPLLARTFGSMGFPLTPVLVSALLALCLHKSRKIS